LFFSLDSFGHYAYNVGIVAELLGTFEQTVLLAVLKLADEAYGRSILRAVQVALDRAVVAGAIYATLDRLEQKKLISSRLDEGTPARNGRARRYYRLTVSGVRALNESKAALERMWQGTQWPLRWPA
jgi:DNA-binding PadR family transcriptional regulator